MKMPRLKRCVEHDKFCVAMNMNVIHVQSLQSFG